MITTDQITKAVIAAGFDQETLTGFLISGRLALELAAIDAQIRNVQAARTVATQETEAQIQALQAAKVAKQAEIDVLGG